MTVVAALFARADELLAKNAPQYWAFVRRPRGLSNTTGLDGLGGIEGYVLRCAFFSVVFILVNLTTAAICKRYFTRWWASLGAAFQRLYPAYLTATIHHVLVVPWCWYRLYCDWHLPASEWGAADYGPVDAWLCTVLAGYLVADTLLFALPERSLEFAAHHVGTIWVMGSGMSAHNSVARLVPHMLLSETTALAYNASFVLKRLGWSATSWPCLCLELVFALTYPVIRCLMVPAVFLAIALEGHAAAFGLARFAIAPMCALQYYWFFLILLRLVAMLTGGKGKGGGGAKGSSGKEDKLQ